MSTNAHDSTWTVKNERAVELLVEDKLGDRQIAAEVGINTTTLTRWKHRPDFQKRFDEIRAEQVARMRHKGIARLERRIARLDNDWHGLQQLIAERGDDPHMQDVPGGTTGLLVHTYKALGSGPLATIVDEYAVDTGTLGALLALEKQAAQELGQWADKQEVSGTIGVQVIQIQADKGTHEPDYLTNAGQDQPAG